MIVPEGLTFDYGHRSSRIFAAFMRALHVPGQPNQPSDMTVTQGSDTGKLTGRQVSNASVATSTERPARLRSFMTLGYARLPQERFLLITIN